MDLTSGKQLHSKAFMLRIRKEDEIGKTCLRIIMGSFNFDHYPIGVKY